MADTDNRDAEMRLLYQDSLDNIRDLKRQQWSVTYYSVLLYAALVGVTVLARAGQSLGPWLQHAISVAAIAVALACSGVILYSQHKLRRRRVRLHYIRDKHFHQSTNELPDSNKPGHTSFAYNWPMWSLMLAVTLAGAGFVIRIVWW